MKLTEITRFFRVDSTSRGTLRANFRTTLTVSCLAIWCLSAPVEAEVSHGSEEGARTYYRALSKSLRFATPDSIFQTTLDDVAAYLGYGGITGLDLQNIPSNTLMDPVKLLAPCDNAPGCTNVLQKREAVLASLGAVPIRPDDILVSRFFAPKIMNIKDPEETRKLGWRKLVRMKARTGSAARENGIESAIVLFNFFTDPGVEPFRPDSESVNTQVMLITEPSLVPQPGKDGRHTLYWLDYDALSKGGALSFALNASFDANELPASSEGTRPYFVPDGCIACHGANTRRSMVNYLDTDHWFDRLETDFQKLKAANVPLIFDAGTNDTNSLSYIVAFDVIRRFNEEADAQAKKAQPEHDEALAAEKWLSLHANSNQHFLPEARKIGPEPGWSSDPADVATLDNLNQFCFRCHGTIKFSVFNKSAVIERKAFLRERLAPDAPLGMRMPPDRPLPDEVRKLLLDSIK